MDAVRWPLVEIDCTSLDKIIKNSDNLFKIKISDLEEVGVKKFHVCKDKNVFLSKCTSFNSN